MFTQNKCTKSALMEVINEKYFQRADVKIESLHQNKKRTISAFYNILQIL